MRAIIGAYLEDGEPVGSHTLARGACADLSPASLRVVMGHLEEQGLLSQPHPSAGRVPTDQAWRFWTDEILAARRRARPRDEAALHEALARAPRSGDGLLQEACRVLSDLSGNIGLISAPAFARLVLERVEFVRLDERLVLAILVDPAGGVTHRRVTLDAPVSQSDLDRMTAFVRTNLAGLTVAAARARLAEMRQESEIQRDALIRQALAAAESCLADLDAAERRLFVVGASHALDPVPEAGGAEARALLEALEEERRLCEILDRCLEEHGVSAVIGSEHADPRLRSRALLATPYGPPGRALGAVAMIGPTRMAYGRSIALLESLSRALAQALHCEEA